MAWAERRNLIEQIENERHSRVICYVTSDRQGADATIQKDAIPLFLQHLQSIGSVERLDVFLFTAGGDTLAAFGLARLLREFSRHLGVLVPLRCHSAGTLLALGANEIVMTNGATLSPIDPSVVGPLNPAIELAPGQRQLLQLSVETVAGFKDLVTDAWGLTGDALTAAFRALFDKVHPLALGDVYRARRQIEHLARTLLMEHRDEPEQIEKVIATLARELGSHDYPITRRDARALLGSHVAADAPQVERLMWNLYRDYEAELQLRRPFLPEVELAAATARGPVGSMPITQRLAFVETTSSGDAAERDLVLTPVQVLPPGIPPQLAAQMAGRGPMQVQVSVVRGEWRHYASS
jgi:hypothetical protein